MRRPVGLVRQIFADHGTRDDALVGNHAGPLTQVARDAARSLYGSVQKR